MPLSLRQVVAAAAFAATCSAVFVSPATAQQRAGVMGELIKDMHDVHGKLVALAKAMPANTYGWRPEAGVRSVSEVFLHVASDNYLLPSAVGVAPDPSTGIKTDDMKTLGAFEKQSLNNEAMAAALDKSFGHLAKAMNESPDSKLDDKVKFFGQDFTTRQLWILTVTHLHEHLGQAIAYARSNHVKPPWSK